MQKIGVLGNGSWSSALVKILTDNGISVNWWMRSTDAITHINNTQHNLHYLSSVKFPLALLTLYSNIEKVIDESDIIIVGIPSAYVGSLLEPLRDNIFHQKTIVSAIKGILPQHDVLLNKWLESKFYLQENQYMCIAGPCHAEEIALEKLSYLTFAAQNENIRKKVGSMFENSYVKTVYSNDVDGVQYAAVLKNIYALGAGIAHGLDYGDNFLSVYITNCFCELQQFMEIISSNTQHHYNTSAYLGDLLVTCYSLHSRNRTFGNYIGKGYSVNAAKLELNMIAEGYFASKGIHEICTRLNYQLPIAKSIYRILWEQESAKENFKKIEMLCN